VAAAPVALPSAVADVVFAELAARLMTFAPATRPEEASWASVAP